MATKQAVVNVQVNTPKTLGQLENELEQINEQLKDVQVGSKAFKTLASQAQKAGSEIKDLETQFEGLSFEDKTGAIGDAAAGITGAFSLATQGVGLFGEEAAEGFGKAEAQALQYIQAMEGIENVTKLFRGTTIQTFKGMAKGFTDGIKSVRLFGLSSAASLALATAGITVLIAAIIALVANFDKVTDWFKDLAEELPILQAIVDGFTLIGEAIGYIDNLWDGFIGGLKSLGDESKSFADGFKEALDASIEFEKQEEKLEKFRKEGIKDLERELKIAESLKDNEVEVFKIKENILKTEIELLKSQEKLNKEETQNLKDLETELKVLENQEKTRGEQLKIEEAKTKEGEKQEKLTLEMTKQLEAQERLTRQIALIRQGSLTKSLEEEQALLSNILYTLEEINNPLTDRQRAEFELTDLFLKRAKVEREILALNKEIPITQEEVLQNLNDILNAENDLLDIDIRLEKQRKKLQIIQNNRHNAISEEVDLYQESVTVQDEIADVTQLKFISNVLLQNKLIKEQRDDVEENGTSWEQLTLKLEEAAFAIATIGEFAALGFDAMFVSLENQLIDLDKRLEGIRKEQEEFNENEIDYQALLKDANGEKFAEIEAGMLAQDALREELEGKEKAALNEIAQKEYEQEKIKKEQAIVDSIIRTALAVVGALPNVPLSIIAGVLGLAQTGIIAAQKIPEPVQYYDGGYTGEGGKFEPAGIVHKEEYVVPTDVMQTALGSEMVNILEGIRGGMRGFADGGFTSTPEPSLPSTANVNNITREPMFVSVTEIREVGRNVDVLETKSSL